MLIGAVVRGGRVIIPTGETRVEPGDQVIAIVTYRALRKAEAVLAGAGPVDA
jgi:trk system potassium uptake protein TrkA